MRVPILPDDLPGAWEATWAQLTRAVADRRHGFHTPTLCTVTPDGLPAARTVVLRRADRVGRMLVAHTDVRSTKARDLAASAAAAAWAMYDAGLRLQVRARGPARLETTTALAEAQWRGATVSSRRCYLAPGPPGAAAEGPDPNLPEDFRHRQPTPEESEQGRGNFGVIVCELQEIDVLELGFDGHVRVAFSWNGEGADTPSQGILDGWSGRWVLP